MTDRIEDIEREVALVGRIQAIPTILRVLCDMTGMGFSAVARVTDGTWTACAVLDEIGFGLKPGGQLDVDSTLCKEVRASRTPVVIDRASSDPVYCNHHTPRTYSIESYVSVPVVLPDGRYFGNLCAIDPRPAQVSDPKIVQMFVHFADLIAKQLESERRDQLVQSALLDERAEGEFREQITGILGQDLREPITSISLLAQRLRARADDADAVRSLAGEVATQSKRAGAILGRAADFASTRLGGAIEVQATLCDALDESLVAVIADAQAAHPMRTLSWDIDVSRPVRVDRGRIQQLLANLLGNALEHGRPGGAVKVVALSTPSTLRLSVWNEGDTFPSERLGREFAPNWQAGGTGGRAEGLRLGLHICAQIVAAHGGEISVSHSDSAGTTVEVSLPG